MRNDYKVYGDETVIYVRRKTEVFECLLDTEDFILAGSYNKWNISAAGYVTDGNKYLHRILMNAPSGLQVDHIDGNPLNNRKRNLRIVSDGQNKQNFQKVRSDNKSSGIRGVSYSKSVRKWVSYVWVSKKRYCLGSFENKEDAEKAVINARSNLMPFSKEAREDITVQPVVIKKRREIITKSGIRGVSYISRARKWRAEVFKPIKKYLGQFESIDEAEAAIISELKMQEYEKLNNCQ